ncbi:thiolase family protein [Phenylobacterium terrae]|uniref:Thiolase family protein n=1 Tax=Phenylobacterium terrae TaxID=2665495 RepID=A0ABW4MXH0_9CAUL
MSFDRVEIPYGAYWSTPFAKWQGALQHLHAMKFAAWVAKGELARRNIDPESFDTGVFGMTNTQYQSFYGAPWPLYEIGATRTPGHMITQVCATGARVVFAGASEIQLGMAEQALIIAADRCSNGPHIYYPAPKGPGGYGQSEDQVTYNMMNDAIAGHSMLETAENVARKYQITTEEQHEVVLRRYEQYQDALADDHAFQKRYMTLPFSVPKHNFKGEDAVLAGDEGVFATSKEALARLKPVQPDGTVTFGGQTHPADGNVGLILTTPERARELSTDPAIRVTLRGFGQARAELKFMPEAPIAATQKALDHAGVSLADVVAIKSHNPFAVNDIAFARATGADVMAMNNYGSSLIWGHPQGPTGLRAIVELIEELAIRGGGIGLFQGCAAGDSSMAAVVEVSQR